MLETNFPTWAFSHHPFFTMVQNKLEDDEDITYARCVYVLAYNAFQSIKCAAFFVPQYFFDEHNFTLSCEHLRLYFEISKLVFRILFGGNSEDVMEEIKDIRRKDLIRSIYVPYSNTEFHLDKFRHFSPKSPNIHLDYLANKSLTYCSESELDSVLDTIHVTNDWQAKAILRFLLCGFYKQNLTLKSDALVENKVESLLKYLYENYNIMTIELIPNSDDESIIAGFLDAKMKPILAKVFKLDDENTDMLEDTDPKSETFEFCPEDYDEAKSMVSLLENKDNLSKQNLLPILHHLTTLDNEYIDQFLKDFGKSLYLSPYFMDCIFEENSVEELQLLVDILKYAVDNNHEDLMGKIAWVLIYNYENKDDKEGYEELLRESQQLLYESYDSIRINKSFVNVSSEDDSGPSFERKGDFVYGENLYVFSKDFTSSRYDFMSKFKDYAKEHLSDYFDLAKKTTSRVLQYDYLDEMQSLATAQVS